MFAHLRRSSSPRFVLNNTTKRFASTESASGKFNSLPNTSTFFERKNQKFIFDVALTLVVGYATYECIQNLSEKDTVVVKQPYNAPVKKN